MTGRDDRDRRQERQRDEKFVRDILARTSGSPCARAEAQLPALVDGGLEGLDRQLVQSHLEHCAGCRAVAVVLGWAGPQLSGMAELDPGPAFTARVLAATSQRRRVVLDVAEPPRGLAGVMDRLGRWWQDRILQPGFAAQAAYVATVVLVLLTAVPGAPLEGVPARALETVTAGPRALPLVGPALDAASAWIDGGADAVSGTVGRQATEVGGDLESRGERAAPARARMWEHLQKTADLGRDGRLCEAGYEFLAALRAGREGWRHWWSEDAGPAASPADPSGE